MHATLPATWRLGYRPAMLLMLVGLAVGVSLYLSLLIVREWMGMPRTADWETLRYAAYATDPFDRGGWRWSPVAAVLLQAVVWVGPIGWRLLHVAALGLLRPWWMVPLVLVSFPFWKDMQQGNVLTFVFVAAWLALRGNRPAVLVYYALCLLIPRPLMLPVMAWLLWRESWSRRWFVGLAAVSIIGLLLVGHGGEWIARLLDTTSGEIAKTENWLPSRWIGTAWIPIGLGLAAVLTWRGHLGLASIAASPYLLTYYLFFLLLELIPYAKKMTGTVPLPSHVGDGVAGSGKAPLATRPT